MRLRPQLRLCAVDLNAAIVRRDNICSASQQFDSRLVAEHKLAIVFPLTYRLSSAPLSSW
jgi:hypothetical protein